MSTPTISFELMPPRTSCDDPSFWEAVDNLVAVHPDFVSVTYGAGGHNRDTAHAVTARLVRQAPIRTLAHLTCVGASRGETTEVIDSYLASGVRSFLALRGDQPQGRAASPDALKSSIELIALLRSREALRCAESASAALRSAVAPLIVSVATFPAGNPAAGTTPTQEVERLLVKQAAGASFAITQLFYDADIYLNFVDEARQAGVTIPILAGILPATHPRRLRRVAELTGVAPDPLFMDALENAADPASLGIAESGRVIERILAAGAPGVHLYTFNQAKPTLQVLAAANLIKPETI